MMYESNWLNDVANRTLLDICFDIDDVLIWPTLCWLYKNGISYEIAFRLNVSMLIKHSEKRRILVDSDEAKYHKYHVTQFWNFLS